jgi:murein L,D-transpeptidase YafK
MGLADIRIGRRRLIGSMAAAVALARAVRAETPETADRILVLKAARTLQLLKDDDVIATYPVALGSEPVGPKHRLGDGRTPEGRYVIDGRSDANPYHLALHISYPNASDRARARRAGYNPGGNICVHGLPDGFEELDPVEFSVDWTRGCIAVSDRAIEEIWRRVADGTPIDIRA